MEKERPLYTKLVKRTQEKSPLIQVILGPRQIGKTTIVKQLIQVYGGTYKSADGPLPPSYEDLKSWWGEASSSTSKILVIDEIQKVPSWSEIIKELWDKTQEKNPLKVLLTGSSSLLMQKGLTESLLGRYELIQAEHWGLYEAQEIFSLTLREYINFGCYPGSIRFLGDKERWGSYIANSVIEPVLSRDLLQLSHVKSPHLLRQIFSVACAYPAQIISLTKLMGNLTEKGTKKTLKNYLKLLSNAYLISTIEKYSTRQIKTKESIPKFIIHDNALIRALERPVSQDLSSERFGHYFENSIASRFIESGYETYYWRERGYEVDLVVISPNNEKWAIEVKTGKVKEADLKGLKYFCKKFPDFSPKLISLESVSFDFVEVLDYKEVLSLRRA